MSKQIVLKELDILEQMDMSTLFEHLTSFGKNGFDDLTWGLVMTQHMLARILKLVSYVTKDTSNSNIPHNSS